MQIIGDVERKTRIRAAVRPDVCAVHEHRRFIIRTLEVQQRAFFALAAYARGIPNRFVHGLIADPARLRFVRERHVNLARQLSRQRVRLVHFPAEPERPASVEVDPVLPHQLRAGIIFEITSYMLHNYSVYIVL